MTLINVNKLKEKAAQAVKEASDWTQQAAKDASEWTSQASKDAADWTSQTAKNIGDKTGELSTNVIRTLLKGIDLDGLMARVDEYQQKTGKDATPLVSFINNLKQLQQDGE